MKQDNKLTTKQVLNWACNLGIFIMVIMLICTIKKDFERPKQTTIDTSKYNVGDTIRVFKNNENKFYIIKGE